MQLAVVGVCMRVQYGSCTLYPVPPGGVFYIK